MTDTEPDETGPGGQDASGREDASGGDGDRVVSILGVDVVVEEEFLSFPWRAGLWRAPVAFVVVFALVVVLALVGGLAERDLADQVALLGLITYNAHNVAVTSGSVPGLLQPVAEPLSGVTGVWRLVRGLFVVGFEHADPLGHLVRIVSGESEAANHTNFLEGQRDPDVPLVLYYLVPVSVLVGVGYEYASSHWEAATTDSPLEVVRFGIAIALGYVAMLLVGSVVFTLAIASPLFGALLVFPDRYLVVVFGFAYPAIFASLGAGIVYVQREVLDDSRADEDDPVVDGDTAVDGESAVDAEPAVCDEPRVE